MHSKIRSTMTAALTFALGLGLAAAADDFVSTTGEARGLAAAPALGASVDLLAAAGASPAMAPSLPAGAPGAADDAPPAMIPPPPPGAAAAAPPLAVEPMPAPGYPPVPSTDSPSSTLEDLIEYARTGRGRLVVGAAIVLLVGLLRRHGLKRIPWFSTKAGGYVAGFGTTAALFIGGCLGADMLITWDVIGEAIAIGFIASGQHEAARDVAIAARARGVQMGTTMLVLAAFGGALLLVTAPGCGAAQRAGGPAVLVCAGENEDAISALIAELRPLVGAGSVDWGEVYAKAKAAGALVGGCALVAVIREHYAPAGYAPMSAEASETLERFRLEVAGGARWRTEHGDI